MPKLLPHGQKRMKFVNRMLHHVYKSWPTWKSTACCPMSMSLCKRVDRLESRPHVAPCLWVYVQESTDLKVDRMLPHVYESKYKCWRTWKSTACCPMLMSLTPLCFLTKLVDVNMPLWTTTISWWTRHAQSNHQKPWIGGLDMPSRTTRSLESIIAPDHCPCLSLPFYLNLPHGWRFQIVEVQYQVEH